MLQQVSLRAFEEHLIPLKTLTDRVEAFAEQCLPDFIYTKGDPSLNRDFTFAPIPIDECVEARMLHGISDDHLDLDIVGLTLADSDGATVPYVLTRWARSQVLSHLGAREKWFDSVPLPQQADELNQRRHTFAKHKLRLMRSGDDGARVVRGLVSSVYAEIPDTDIMKAMTALMPDGQVLRYHSGKTDRAFYAYIVSPQSITIPGSDFEAYPGVVLKNSEVGYTSLWMIPTMWFPKYDSVLTFVPLAPFKRIHRGRVEDLRKEFMEALITAGIVWGELDEQVQALAGITYATTDDAVDDMKTVLVSCGSSKLFAFRCEQAYQAANHRMHTGRTVLSAVLEVSRRQLGEDATHDHSAIAGALLLKLTK